MPRYKLVGNRILTRVENALTGLELSEWHSGYRAYRVDALADIAFERNSDGFDFDTEIILQLHAAGKTIVETPIPTYYGDEICYVNGLVYAKDVVADAARYRLRRLGFGDGVGDDDEPYELKLDRHVVARPAARPSAPRAARTGARPRLLGRALRRARAGARAPRDRRRSSSSTRTSATGSTPSSRPTSTTACPPRSAATSTRSSPPTCSSTPSSRAQLLSELIGRLAADGTILTSVPNFAHWYPRGRVAIGRFDYDRRGILDRGHVRFFTRRSFERMVCRRRSRRAWRAVVGSPIEVTRARRPRRLRSCGGLLAPSIARRRRSGRRCSGTSSSTRCNRADGAGDVGVRGHRRDRRVRDRGGRDRPRGPSLGCRRPTCRLPPR